MEALTYLVVAGVVNLRFNHVVAEKRVTIANTIVVDLILVAVEVVALVALVASKMIGVLSF
jgi:hypothetical protein